MAPEFFDGLEQYSHCWVLYVFHMNTGKHWASSFALLNLLRMRVGRKKLVAALTTD